MGVPRKRIKTVSGFYIKRSFVAVPSNVSLFSVVGVDFLSSTDKAGLV